MSCTNNFISVATICMHACIMKVHTFNLHCHGKIHNGYVHMHECMYINLHGVQRVNLKQMLELLDAYTIAFLIRYYYHISLYLFNFLNLILFVYCIHVHVHVHLHVHVHQH